MTKLTDIILKQIALSGPITVAEYMTQCLLHPKHGYYTTQQPLGQSGDFITAPEISQMFGEMIGLCLAQAWIDQGRPNPFTLAEIGPGRGVLMQDILKAGKHIPGFLDAADIHLIEASPRLRDEQKQTLDGFEVNWVDTITDVPDAPLFLVANEFLDCLPIRQFLRTDMGWQEQMVTAENNKLGFMLGAQKPVELWGQAPMGTYLETCASANAIAEDLGRVISTHGGLALLIDYGDWVPKGDTFQAINAHKKVDPFYKCGQTDLTAHVNFSAVSKATEKYSNVSGLATQGEFLERLGITARAQTLAQNLSGDALENHILAHRRLTHPDEMGTLFKVLAITPKTAPPAAGFVQ